MTSAASSSSFAGFQPVGNYFIPDTTQRHTLGTKLNVVDPYWGGQEVIYLAIPTSTALSVGSLVTWDNTDTIAAAPNTANLGQPVAFCLNAVASNASSVQYGWFVISGAFVSLAGASVAANTAFGITAAGKTGAIANGKQIVNARVQVAATKTVVKANSSTQNGSTVLKVTNSDGWFVGLPLSGTGIAGSTTISAISSDGTTVTMNNAATATGAVSVTGTYNDGSSNYWNTITCERPFAQGQVT